ncbi:hypothetical protein ATANTOWER_032011, partial [Ataeniobius toweri]|nr:hypothetical protein [Ataeniobius toweri]
MQLPSSCLCFGHSKPQNTTVGTSQQDQTDNGMITLWEYLRRAAEKSSRQAAEERKQRSLFWGSRLAIPLPGTGPLCHRPSPRPHSKPLAPACTSSLFAEFGTAHSSCSDPAPSRRRCRGASVPVSEGC